MENLPAGLTVGHADDSVGLTGLTVLLFDSAVSASAIVRGSAPATSDFSTLDPIHGSPRIDGILLTGGSCFGLAAVAGVQRFLEDRGQGLDVGVTGVPIVPAAAIFDIGLGDYTARPTARMALDACLAASNAWPREGSVGAGTGATVGKFLGMERAMRGGFGISGCLSPAGAQVVVVVVVNSFGDVWYPGRERIMAGARWQPDEADLANSGLLIAQGWRRVGFGPAAEVLPPVSAGAAGIMLGEPAFSGCAGSRVLSKTIERQGLTGSLQAAGQQHEARLGPENTTLVALVTTARLDILQLRKLADFCMTGLADVVYPACTIYDGDLSLAVSAGAVEEDLTTLCLLAQQMTATAILSAVQKAEPAHGVPAWRDLNQSKV